ncbi:MAG: cardiolipin synthase, partial [Clostridia bacterium]|nr:cardiolipin synthase [Clostridia bacterium]
KLVHMTTVSYYRELIEDGVKIYEYTPGFMHAKTFVSDDITAMVGTANLDFRSLYLHYECGVRIYGGDVIAEMKKDYLSTIEKCEEITLEKCKAGFFKSLWQSVLRIFAPLL